MPFGEEFSSTLVVQAGGSPLAADLAALLVSGYVDHRNSVPDMFLLAFSDEPGTLLSKASIKVGTPMTLSVQQTGPGGPVRLLSGEVTTLEKEVGPAGVHTIIRGFDHSHRLFRGRRVVAYLDNTAGDIVRTVAQRAGLKAGDIQPNGPVLAHVSQDGVNDWDFLSRLAAQTGSALSVVDGAVNFGPPTAASTAPDGSSGSLSNPLVLQHGKNLLYLRATVTSADQVPEVELRGWSVQNKRARVSVAPAKTSSAALSIQPAELANTFNSPRFVTNSDGFDQQSQYDAAAVAIADQLAGAFAELTGSVRGNPRVRPGAAVALTGVGAPFEGRYSITASRHEFSAESGYVTEFTVSNTSDRSLYGLAAGGTKKADTALPGVASAVVTATKDPMNLGRVKVMFPQLSEAYESAWARTVQAGAGKGRGAVILPEVGDEVLVAFENGSLDWPYVLGGVFNGVDTPDKPWTEHLGPTDGAIVRRAFASRSGMLIEFLESPDTEQLTVSTSGGKQRITLTQKQSAGIEIVSEGPVAVTAKGDVSVTTSSGDVALKGKNVTIEAQSDLQITGATVAVKGRASAELSATSVKVTGEASAELTATGTITVRGALVKIN